MQIDEILMERCLDTAWQYQTLTLPNPAVAAMVYDSDGEIISLEAHQKAGLPHAEVLAVFWAYVRIYARSKGIKLDSSVDFILGSTLESNRALQAIAPLWQSFQASRQDFAHIALEDLPSNSHAIHAFISTYHNGIFYDKTILLTLEPCNHFGKTPPCAQLIAQIRPKKVRILARDVWGKSANGSKVLEQAGIAVEFMTSKALQERASDLLYPFLCLREYGRFVVFKLASRLDGSYKNGQISGDLSRIFTHNQRTIAQSLIISGATARDDRPRLDTRYATPPYAGTRVPDVGIFTRDANSIDRSIPLFHIDSRIVRTYDDKTLQNLPQGFIIIEGSLRLYEYICSLLERAPLLLLHLSSSIAHPMDTHQALESITLENLSFRILHATKLDRDLLLWLKL